ncbi:alpha-L-fucosidase [Coprobacter tertius]|uniref:alpha-L-fucosidase n=1 Tax=Coprobacter tertius TaxID=2944915 RepID=A0ABT1ML76_9BACT|nr:alpha-L-fucosidase [Coprobacter tertius]MCP9612626.1 alpha-L-fucosidase [Coprobacter tertius]
MKSLFSCLFILLSFICIDTFTLFAQPAPEPCGPLPNERQIKWYNDEIIAFFHFGINTFENNVNEGDGRAGTFIFNPTALDCRQWTGTLKSAGIPAGILVAKHADGFCNWPSAYTDYCVKNSPWRNGKGNLVKEYAEACRADSIGMGLYLGPHDRHEHLSPLYTKQRYEDYYANQLTELLTDYGPVYEIWWDGAGADELTISMYTRWYNIVRRLQPECVIFGTRNSYCFADVRWVGNESGIAGNPCWSTINPESIRDENDNRITLNHGEVNGSAYIPAESDVSIRPSWFYHSYEDKDVKTVKQLWDIYCNSVGHNSVMLLNFAPDRRGLVPAQDSINAAGLRKMIDDTFGNNLLTGASVKSLHQRGKQYAPKNLIDNLSKTYYASKDSNMTDSIVFDLKSPVTFDCLMLQEVIQLGHRTTRWSVDYSVDGKKWEKIPETENLQSIGHKWIVRFDPLKAKKVRLCILDGKACPALHTFGIYKQAILP